MRADVWYAVTVAIQNADRRINMDGYVESKIVSSLEKCFQDEAIGDKPRLKEISILRDERLSFQFIYRLRDKTVRSKKPAYLKIESELKPMLSVRKVENVPCQMPDFAFDKNPNALRTEPGLYPDLLVPLEESPNIFLLDGRLKSLWFTLEPGDNILPGVYPLKIALEDEQGSPLTHQEITIEILKVPLPKQDLIFTQWFHCDCLSVYYNTDAFDESHWKIIRNFMKTAVKNGINMILTPVFTVPLDTKVNGERPTMQLVDIHKRDGKYEFSFGKLKKWVDMAREEGILYFEIAHLFTQWGAAHAPKIMAHVDGEYKRIFGWETRADDDEYIGFLREFLKALIGFFKGEGIDDRCFYHISDEPSLEHRDNYLRARNSVEDILGDYQIMDALSNYEFYKEGLVEKPIPATEHIKPFLENNVEDLWTYYCVRCAIALASPCTRVLGTQFYKFDIKGFLHWGYNFYFNQYSINPINPFLVTDGEYFVPSGDAFTVYPGPGGKPLESIRLVVFHEGIQDMRALKLCEKIHGRKFVLELVDRCFTPHLSFDHYPPEPERILQLRQLVNKAINGEA